MNFDWDNYESTTTYSFDDVKKIFNKLNLKNKKIKSISLLGNIKYFDKKSMLTSYNNFYRKPNEKLRNKIYEEDIPLNDYINRFLCTSDPIKLTFDDDTSICICFKDYGCFNYNLSNCDKKPIIKIDYSKFFKPILNKKIIGVKFNHYSKKRRNIKNGLVEEHFVNLEEAKLPIESIIEGIRYF